MKCPKCNYTSYDGLTSCKKCGYVFKNGSDFKSKASFMPSVSGTKTEREEIAKSKRPPDVSETVASIKASLDEIEAGETESAESSVKEQIDEMESNTIQNEKDDKSIEGGREFPAFDEINWDESVSLSNDGLTFNIDELAGGEKEIGLEEKKSDMSDTKEKKRKEELAKIGEELKQIEEEPEQVETIYPSEYHDTGFDLSKMRKGGFWIRFIAYTIDSVIPVSYTHLRAHETRHDLVYCIQYLLSGIFMGCVGYE